jgi:hypothetical protein
MVEYNRCISLYLETALQTFLKHRTCTLLCPLYINVLWIKRRWSHVIEDQAIDVHDQIVALLDLRLYYTWLFQNHDLDCLVH